MSVVKLQSGRITLSDAEPTEIQDGQVPAKLEKRARLVYAGEFESADGPVMVSDEALEKLVHNHNSVLSKLARMAKGGVPLGHCPPVQLDHSVSARDTIGRLSGNLELGDYDHEDGSKRKAVYSKLTILGRENVERVMDGRWSDLSIGADFEEGKLSECTVTPFPAARDSRMLSQKKLSDDRSLEQQSKILWDLQQTLKTLRADLKKATDETAKVEIREQIRITEDSEASVKKDMEIIKGKSKLSAEGESMKDKEKLKKHLMEVKKMSDKDADDHLAKCEADETEMTALSKEMEEHETK